jgi:hypothetical protein
LQLKNTSTVGYGVDYLTFKPDIQARNACNVRERLLAGSSVGKFNTLSRLGYKINYKF